MTAEPITTDATSTSMIRRRRGPKRAHRLLRARWTKRGLDVVLSLLLLALLLPLLIALCVLVRVTSRGPAIFRQVRVGRHGNPIVVRKLRTMVVDADARHWELSDDTGAGPLFKMH